MFSPALPAPPKVTHDQESLRNAKLSKFLYLRASPASPSSLTLYVLGRKISFPGPQISKKAPAAAVLLKWCKIHLGFQVFLIFSSQTLLTIVSQALCLPVYQIDASNQKQSCTLLSAHLRLSGRSRSFPRHHTLICIQIQEADTDSAEHFPNFSDHRNFSLGTLKIISRNISCP